MQCKYTPHIPKYRLHKSSGRAVVRIDGRDLYLGNYGTKESEQKYNQVISEWLVSKTEGTHTDLKKKIDGLTINELVVGYLDHAKTYYVKNGKPTGEAENIKDALREICQLYGRTRVEDFGPIALKTVRQAMIDNGLCRNVTYACAKACLPPLPLQSKDLTESQKQKLESWKKKHLWSPNQLFASLLSYVGGTSNMEEALRYMEEAYCGEYDSLTDYAEQFIDDCYADSLKDLPEFICYHIDYEGIARDMELGGDVFTLECEGKIHIFYTNI